MPSALLRSFLFTWMMPSSSGTAGVAGPDGVAELTSWWRVLLEMALASEASWKSSGPLPCPLPHPPSSPQEKGHWCRECNKGYTTKQALVAHHKAKHGPAPSVEELTCLTCSKIFKVVKTMREHLATHKGPFPCQVEGCQAGPFSLPKRLNWHLEEAHRFSTRKE